MSRSHWPCLCSRALVFALILLLIVFDDKTFGLSVEMAQEETEPQKIETVLLEKWTRIELVFLHPVNSDAAKVGDPVYLISAKDVFVNGLLIIPQGEIVEGEVYFAGPSKRGGISGRIDVLIKDIPAWDGSKIRIGHLVTKRVPYQGGSSFAGTSIKGGGSFSFGIGISIGSIWKGKPAIIDKGTEVFVRPESDITLPKPEPEDISELRMRVAEEIFDKALEFVRNEPVIGGQSIEGALTSREERIFARGLRILAPGRLEYEVSTDSDRYLFAIEPFAGIVEPQNRAAKSLISAGNKRNR